MINRQNWMDIKEYLNYLERIQQLEPATVKRAWANLRHLLEWADDKPFNRAKSLHQTFPSYLLAIRNDGKPLSSTTITKCLAQARQFFTYARLTWQSRYKSITESWIETLKPPRRIRNGNGKLKNHKYYTIDQVMTISQINPENLHIERCRVAVAMLFCSGMRADTLASLPISCVDLQNNRILQLPEMGVRTKNNKAGITYLLPIDELLNIIKAWDNLVRSQLSENCLWYSPLSRDNSRLIPTVEAYIGRNSTIQKDVRKICRIAGIPYLSPHKLRHGHVMYAVQYARTISDLKAISQNVMHSSVTITDAVYGILSDSDVGKFISSLNSSHPSLSSK